MSLLRDIFIVHNEADFEGPAHCSSLAIDYLCQFTVTFISDTENKTAFFRLNLVCYKPVGDR